MKKNIIITPDLDKLSQKAAEIILDSALKSVKDHDRFSIALSGGSTPKGTYKLLTKPDISKQMPWDKTHIFWGDERCVPPDDPQSNYLMVKKVLLDPLGIPKDHIHRMAGELVPAQAATFYQDELEQFFSPEEIKFDLVLLGMGEDGHTASLFPHTAALHASESVIANHVLKLNMWRLTLSAGVINAAYRVMFLIAGKKKAQVLAEVMEGPKQPDEYPSQMITPTHGELIWLLDKAASAKLRNI
jgi:6-phosphogluconolactonase